jgi:uncharacterized membrane protein YdbT with pleckstrin-like domain
MSVVASGAAVALILLIGGILVGLSTGTALILFLLAVLVTAAWALLETIFWKYTVTEHRIFVRHGLVSVNEQTARLERVQDITLHQSLFDRLFGVGTLAIDTAGTEGGALEFRGLVDPTQVRELLDRAVRAERNEPL